MKENETIEPLEATIEENTQKSEPENQTPEAEIPAKEEKKAEVKEPDFLSIYTDGACSGNPGPGGWGAVMIWGEHEKKVSGGEALTTNNKMELMAAIEGLKCVTRTDVLIKLYTDSLYLQKGMNEWISGWKKKNFKDVKNAELWKELDAIASKFKIEWHWVKAHAGDKYNEIADTLAREAIQK